MERGGGGGGGGGVPRRGLPKLLKEWSYIDIWPFMARSSLFPYAFVWEKTYKNLLLQNWMPCGWIFAYIIGNRRSIKVTKIMVVHWHLTFLRQGQVCFLMHLHRKNVQNFKRLFLWSLWANVAQISFEASLGQGNERLLKWLPSIDQDGCHAHIC